MSDLLSLSFLQNSVHFNYPVAIDTAMSNSNLVRHKHSMDLTKMYLIDVFSVHIYFFLMV